jgi:hypothetical protein
MSFLRADLPASDLAGKEPSMLPAVLIACGAASMALGAVLLAGWVSGGGGRFMRDALQSRGDSRSQRLYLEMVFLAAVLAPLLAGAALIAWGLRMWGRG